MPRFCAGVAETQVRWRSRCAQSPRCRRRRRPLESGTDRGDCAAGIRTRSWTLELKEGADAVGPSGSPSFLHQHLHHRWRTRLYDHGASTLIVSGSSAGNSIRSASAAGLSASDSPAAPSIVSHAAANIADSRTTPTPDPASAAAPRTCARRGKPSPTHRCRGHPGRRPEDRAKRDLNPFHRGAAGVSRTRAAP
jgi:hypothetical protein